MPEDVRYRLLSFFSTHIREIHWAASAALMTRRCFELCGLMIPHPRPHCSTMVGCPVFLLMHVGVAAALQCGADLVVQSAHKTLGSLTQSAFLHLGRGESNAFESIILLFSKRLLLCSPQGTTVVCTKPELSGGNNNDQKQH